MATGGGTGFNATFSFNQNVTLGQTTLPLEVALVVGALLVVAALIFWPVIDGLPDAIDIINNGGPFSGFGWFVLLLLVWFAGFGVAALLVARQLWRRDRVGRALTYVAGAGIVVGVLFAEERSGTEIWMMIAAIAAMVLLGLTEPAQRWFTGDGAPHPALPTPVLAACATSAVIAYSAALVGAGFLALGGAGDVQVQGVLLLAGAAGITVAYKNTQNGVEQGRLVLSGAMVLIAVLLLASDVSKSTSLLVPLGLAGGVLVCLWGPAESRAYFERPAAAV